MVPDKHLPSISSDSTERERSSPGTPPSQRLAFDSNSLAIPETSFGRGGYSPSFSVLPQRSQTIEVGRCMSSYSDPLQTSVRSSPAASTLTDPGAKNLLQLPNISDGRGSPVPNRKRRLTSQPSFDLPDQSLDEIIEASTRSKFVAPRVAVGSRPVSLTLPTEDIHIRVNPLSHTSDASLNSA